MNAANGDYPSAAERSGATVSVKAALRCGDAWVLLRNQRGEWELPGGRIDPGDKTLEDVLRRECREELGIEVQVGELLDAYLFEVIPGRWVTIVSFLATAEADKQLTVSHEHQAVGLFTTEELDDANMPHGYRSTLCKAAREHRF